MIEFDRLVQESTNHLNNDVISNDRSDYYRARNGVKLEQDIYDVMVEKAKGTVFENTIELISNQRFPDIVAAKYYGVEVKTSKGKNWTSTGSSIVESTRIKDVERIYMLFGKLSDPVEFKAKPYEECLSDIVVTHSPRYKIDMDLPREETIFHKMNVDYDTFRKSDSSIQTVKNYYKSKLKPGQELWWIDTEDIEEQSVSPIVRMWNTLNVEERKMLQVKGFAWFPEIFSSSPTKFNRFALWLITQQGVLTTSLRDVFTAGGKIDIITLEHKWESQSRIFFNLSLLSEEVKIEIETANRDWIKEFWGLKEHQIQTDRINQWIDLVSHYVGRNQEQIKQMLKEIFKIN